MVDTQAWSEGLMETCDHFQLDLSCLVDGELDEAAASRAVAHIEICEGCREFFEDVRTQVGMHLDLANPQALIERLGGLVTSQIESAELVRKLAGVFYQLGKAYVLVAVDPGWRTRVFEPALQVDLTQTRGRGFVDGVMASGRELGDDVDWAHARHMLNGRLAKIEGALEKGKRLLDEALRVQPGHEEARIYVAYASAHEGKSLRAAEEFRRIFRTAMSEQNRGHAAMQLGLIYAASQEFRKAVACFRWVAMSGLADIEDRFFVARFDIGMYYAHLREPQRSLRAFRDLLDRHPERAAQVAQFFADSPRLRAVIDSQRGFGDRLLKTCPELFRRPSEEQASPPKTSHADGASPDEPEARSQGEA